MARAEQEVVDKSSDQGPLGAVDRRVSYRTLGGTVAPMAREIKPREPARVFRGTDAVLAGALTRSQLRGPTVRRLFQGCS